MTRFERIKDLMKTGMFNNGEVTCSEDNPNCLRSIEYWQIMHYSIGELYYLGGETEKLLVEAADKVVDTDGGVAYMFS